MKKSEYYSLCFFLSAIWQNVAVSENGKALLAVVTVLYAIYMIVYIIKGE